MNPARSLITLGVLLLAGIIVLFLHTPKLKAERYLSSSIVLMGVLLSLYCLIINVLQLKSLFPTHGYQLVFSRFGSHNHLGDFLLLPLFICLYNLKNNQNRLTNSLLLIFFFPFFILSYSRSAYLSFTVVFVLFLINWLWNIKKSIIKKSVLLLTGGALVSLTATFFIATVFEFKRTPIFGSVNKTLTTHFGLKFKHFGANRLEYANTALQSIKEKPLFGVGPGNFVYASEKYSNIPNYRTHSSHNIFLDIWVEYGSIVFIAVLLLAGIKMRDLLKGKNGNAMLLLALFINFQTDYTFKLVPLMVLFLTVMLIKPAED